MRYATVVALEEFFADYPDQGDPPGRPYEVARRPAGVLYGAHHEPDLAGNARPSLRESFLDLAR